jgi:outer membrane biosynthesis protein TonB
MKLKHTVLGLSLVAFAGFGMAASASAQQPADGGRNYAIDLRADVKPVAQTAMDYPYLAARRGLSGECRVSYDVAGGQAHDVRVVSCTSDFFRGEARRAASSLRFRQADRADDAQLTIRWNIEGDAPLAQTASLR